MFVLAYQEDVGAGWTEEHDDLGGSDLDSFVVYMLQA